MTISAMTATCQCARSNYGRACTRPITQEDLLCDVCRKRCTALIGNLASTGPIEEYHAPFPGFPGLGGVGAQQQRQDA